MIATVQGKYDTLSHLMNERLKRRWAGCEALSSGRGGISAVARATGMSPNTIKRGIRFIKKHDGRDEIHIAGLGCVLSR